MKRRAGRWKARVLSRKTIHRSRFFYVVEEEVKLDGRRFPYAFQPHPGVVHVVALTARRDLVLVRQYRHPLRRALLELPAGRIDAGESALAAAKRELREETGHAARRWIKLGAWPPSPASTNMKSHLFLALGARRVGPSRPERYEFLAVERHPFAALVRRAPSLKDTPAMFQLGLALASRRLGA